MTKIELKRLIFRLEKTFDAYTLEYIETELEKLNDEDLKRQYLLKRHKIEFDSVKTRETHHDIADLVHSQVQDESPTEKSPQLHSFEATSPPVPVPAVESPRTQLLGTPNVKNRLQKSRVMQPISNDTPSKHELLKESIKQDKLSQDLLDLTAKLKSNAMDFQEKLAKDKNLVQSAENLLENNFQRVKAAGNRLKLTSLRNNSLFWFTCFGMIFVIIAFSVMVLIIKLF